MLRKAVPAALAALALCAASASAAPTFSSSDGITVTKVDQLSPRLFDVSLTSTAVDRPLHIRVILPDGYDQSPAKQWPVLYLIHGTSGGASDWTDKGDAEKTTAGRSFITVIPDEASTSTAAATAPTGTTAAPAASRCGRRSRSAR